MERSEQLPWLAILGKLVREKVFSDSGGGKRVWPSSLRGGRAS